jgi:RNA polymerase sigma-70 factor (ECF subfamily)
MDLALVEAARSGDEEAFASIVRGSADRLFAVAHRILRDVGRAEDAVQQTLVTAWRELPALRDIDRFEAWIHRILVNACYTEAKRASNWSANVMALPMDGPATPDPTAEVVTRDALDRGFGRLPAEQRAAFVLHHYLGWSVGEIAESLGVPTETIRSRLRYATSTLRAALDADARTTRIDSRERMA